MGWFAVTILTAGRVVYCTDSDDRCPDDNGYMMPSNMAKTLREMFYLRFVSNVLPLLFRIAIFIFEVYLGVLPSLRFETVVADVDVAVVTTYGALRDWVIKSDEEKDRRLRSEHERRD